MPEQEPSKLLNTGYRMRTTLKSETRIFILKFPSSTKSFKFLNKGLVICPTRASLQLSSPLIIFSVQVWSHFPDSSQI